MLIGYVFASAHESTRAYSYPDIGDLQTVFCRDGDAVLGFHFGFQGVNPIMPLLFQVIRDPLLGNPTVTVRRTARQRAPYPYHNYYLAIELNWFKSGALSVVTSVSPIDPDGERPTGLCPYLLQTEHRVFDRRAAANLSAIADSLAQQVDFGFFPHPSHFVDLPPDFLDPPDDYYKLSVREPDDPVYHATLEPAYVPRHKTQTFQAEKDFPMSTATTANSTTTTTTSNTSNTASTNNSNSTTPDTAVVPSGDAESDTYQGDTTRHCDKGEVTSIAEKGTVKLWKRYQDSVARSRRTGIFITMYARKKGGRNVKEEVLFGRESRYMFLSTSGINIHGRIQHLCSQLNIEFSSPLPDQLLMTGMDIDAAATRAKLDSQLDSALDLTSGDQGVHAAWEPQWKGGRVEDVSMRANGVNHAGIGPLAVTDGAGAGLRRGKVGRTASLSSDKPGYTSDERGSVSSEDARGRKRRRCADVTDVTRAAPNYHDAALLTSMPGQERQPMLNTAWGLATQAIARSPRPIQEQMQSDATQRRSFHLAHILSESTCYLPHGPEGSSSARGSSAQNSSVGASPGIKFESETCPNVIEAEEGKPVVAGLEDEESTSPLKEKGLKTVWTCDRCGQQIRGKKGNLNRHIANKHENIRAFACEKPNCGRKFQTRLNLVRHETAVHLGRPFTCPSCPRAFKSEDDMKAHVKSAHDEPELKLACEICGSCFGRRSTLNRHMAKVHRPKEEQVPTFVEGSVPGL